jgi:glycyl-tRNA synthetase alpha subunit
VTERATLIGRVRQLACGTARAYLEQRSEIPAEVQA